MFSIDLQTFFYYGSIVLCTLHFLKEQSKKCKFELLCPSDIVQLQQYPSWKYLSNFIKYFLYPNNKVITILINMTHSGGTEETSI